MMILHVRVVTGHGGGPEKTILNSPRFLKALGYEAKLAYLHPPGDPGADALRARGRALDADVLTIADRGPFDLSVVLQLIRICRRHRVAVWHAHDYKSNALGLLVRRFWKMRLVTTLHGWTNLAGRVPLYMQIDKRCLRHYEAAICVSEDLVQECVRWGVAPDRCHLIHNAIDTDDYRRSLTPEEARGQLGLSTDGLLVGAVGRLSPEKGFDLLIRAIADLRRAGEPLSLAIAGDGPAHADLQRLILELNASSFIQLLGHVPDPKRLFQALDVFALSSLREALPNVLLEAMALETPVVATRVAGIPQVVADGEDGLLVAPNHIEELAAAIRRLAHDPALRAQFATTARATIEARFSFRRRMEKVAAIYDRLLGVQRGAVGVPSPAAV